jgi:hypothetical protein
MIPLGFSKSTGVMKRVPARLNSEAASFYGTETAMHDPSRRFEPEAESKETNEL